MRLYIEGTEVSYSGSITFKLQQAAELGELIGLVANDTVEVAATKELNTALGEVAYRFKGGDIDFTGVIEDDKGVCTNVVATLQGANYKKKQIKSYSFMLKTGNAAWFERLRNTRVMDVYPLSETPATDDNWLRPDKDPESTTIMYAYAVGADNWRGRSYVRYDDGFRFVSAKTALIKGFLNNGLSFFSGSDPAYDVLQTLFLPVSKQWNGKPIEIAQIFTIEAPFSSVNGIRSQDWVVLEDNYNSYIIDTASGKQYMRFAFKGSVNMEVYFDGVLDPLYPSVGLAIWKNTDLDFYGSALEIIGSNEYYVVDSGCPAECFISNLAGIANGAVVKVVISINNAEPQWNPNAYCDPAHFIPEQWTVADVLKGCASLFDLRIKTDGVDVTCLPPLTSELLNGDYSEQFLKAPDGIVDLDLMKDQKLTLTDVKQSTYLKYVDPEIASYKEVADANNWNAWGGLFGTEDTEFDTYETYKFVAAPNALCTSVSVVGQPTTLLPSIAVADNTDPQRPVIVDMVPLLGVQSEAIPLTKWSANFGATTTTKRLFRFFQYNKFANNGMQLTFGSYDSNPSLGEGLNRLKINQILDNRKLTARFGYWNGRPDVTIGIDSTTWNIAGGNYTPAKGTLNELTLLPVDATSPTDVSKQLELNILEFDPRDGYAAEAQTLSIDGDELTISGGNTVTIPSGDPTMGGDLSGTASNAQIVAGAVGTTEIADDAVTAAKIAVGAVGSSELASTSVVPGTYNFTTLTVDSDGRLTAASSGSSVGTDLSLSVPAANQAQINSSTGTDVIIAGDASTIELTVSGATTTIEAIGQKTEIFGGSGTTNGVDYGTFTWSKDPKAKIIEIYVWGAGSGGGAGRASGLAEGRSGGGSGSSGAMSYAKFFPTQLLTTETITVGQGGTGGAAVLANNNGIDGTIGGTSGIGALNGANISAPNKLFATRGGAGGGGTTTGGTAGSATSLGATFPAVVGVAGNIASPNGANANTFNDDRCLGSAAGGSISAGNACGRGGHVTNGVGSGTIGIARTYRFTPTSADVSGGTAGTIATNAGNGSSGFNGSGIAGGCGGAGGGSGLIGGAGGKGGWPGGGGGGGGAGVTNSGKGGDGANGAVIIITHY